MSTAKLSRIKRVLPLQRRSTEEFHGLVSELNAMSFSPGGTRLVCSVAGEGTQVWEPVCLK